MCGAQEDFIAYCSVASQLASDWDKFHGEEKLISEKTERFAMTMFVWYGHNSV